MRSTAARERPAAEGRAIVDRRRTETRQRLLDVALGSFAEHGYDRTTIASLERAVGLSPGSGGLYRHFASKEELLVAAVDAYGARVRALRERLAAAEPLATAEAELRRVLGALLDFLSGERAAVQVSATASSLPDAVRHAIGDSWDEGYGILEDLLVRHGHDPEGAAVLAVEAIGSLNHYFAHVGSWRQEPGRVPTDVFVESWIRRWSVVLASAGR